MQRVLILQSDDPLYEMIWRIGENQFEIEWHIAGPNGGLRTRPATGWDLLILSSKIRFQPV